MEPEFKNKFNDLKTEPQIEVTKKDKAAPNEVEAITAATITSKAVVEIVNAHLDILKNVTSEMGL